MLILNRNLIDIDFVFVFVVVIVLFGIQAMAVDTMTVAWWNIKNAEFQTMITMSLVDVNENATR